MQSLNAVLKGCSFCRGRNMLEKNKDTQNGKFLLRGLFSPKVQIFHLSGSRPVLRSDQRSQFDNLGEMASHGLKDQDRLEGASNQVIWKTRILVVLEEYDLEAYIKSVVVVLADNDQKKKYKAKQGKVKRFILDGVRDHVVSHLRGKDTA